MQYTREDACRAWLAQIILISRSKLPELLESYGSAEALYQRFVQTDGRCLNGLIPELQIEALRGRAEQKSMHQMLVRMKQLSIGVMYPEKLNYPPSLMQINDPPQVLFYQGDPSCLLGRCVSIVGSRKASPFAVQTTETIAHTLAKHHVTIISGLAEGIDTAAHMGCLQGGGKTAAVLGCGLDINYPVSNERMRERILAEGGILLSEYPIGTIPRGFNFPVRNRILTGLGKILLMMECKPKSGSMTSVQHALNQGKDVYAFPGRVGTEWAEGAHVLLREGAVYFTTAQDVLSDLDWLEDINQLDGDSSSQTETSFSLTDEQHKILTCLSKEECSFDELTAMLQLDAPTLSSSLTMLQLMGLIKTQPGKIYSRS